MPLYNSPHILQATPSGLWPAHTNIIDMALAGIGVQSPRIGTRFHAAPPPQQGQDALLTHPTAGQHPGADCPTCNLIAIPYNPNLPVLRM